MGACRTSALIAHPEVEDLETFTTLKRVNQAGPELMLAIRIKKEARNTMHVIN